MVRTKNQAMGAHTGTARRLTEVNGVEGSRVGTTTEGAEGEEASSATSSERSRREARRGKAALPDTSAASNEDDQIVRMETGDVATDDRDTDSGECHMTPAGGAVCSENYYTALEGEAEEDSSGEPSEAPSIKSRNKPRQGGSHGGRTHEKGAGKRAPGIRRGSEV